MSEQIYHEVIDYRDLSSGLTHHFFPSEGEARAWINTFLPAVRHQLVYIHRAWGPETLMSARIQRHGPILILKDKKKFEVDVRGVVNVTKTLTFYAADTDGARNQARAWMAERGDNPMNWALGAVEDQQVESVNEA